MSNVARTRLSKSGQIRLRFGIAACAPMVSKDQISCKISLIGSHGPAARHCMFCGPSRVGNPEGSNFKVRLE